MERDVKIGKISKELQTEQQVEILTALRKLGEQITSEEAQFLSQHGTAALDAFEKVSIDAMAGKKALDAASSQIKGASKH